MNKTKRYTILSKVYFSGLLLVPLVLIVLPADFFDHGQSLCPSVVFFHRACLGCGITRAIQHLIHFDFATAYHFNKLSVIVLPILIAFWIREVIRVYKKLKMQNG